MNRVASWRALVSQLKTLPQFSKLDHPREIELFLEIEAVLHFYETICPEPQARDAHQAWALITGYFIRGINDMPAIQKQCLLLRDHLRYVRTATAWHWRLDSYMRQPSAVRLYAFQPNARGIGLGFEQKRYE